MDYPTLFNMLTKLGSALLPAQVAPSGAAATEAVPVDAGEVAAPLTDLAAGQTPASEIGWIYPSAQSDFAGYVDGVNNFINIVSVVCFVGIVLFMAYFAVKFRRRDPHQKALSQVSHNTALELAWTLPPLFICFFMFYLGFDGFMTLASPPDNSYQIKATASKWNWTFTHPNARVDAQEGDILPILHVPAGEPVVIQIESRDVLHSLFIPAFRVKKDAVPGRYTYLWFRALNPTPNAYDQHADKTSNPADKLKYLKTAADHGFILYCSEFCGTNHSLMLARVVVHPKGWRPAEQDLSSLPPEKRGELYFSRFGCASCHQLKPGAPKLVGPTFAQGIFGTEETLTTGTKIQVTDDYLFESIRKPAEKIVAGHLPGQMPPQDAVSDDQIKDIIEYIKTIGNPPAP